MSKVKSSKTKPELTFKKQLRINKIAGFRTGINMIGKPDFVNAKCKIAVFIDGCFWHKCPVDFRMPKSNKIFWTRKIKSNTARDRKVNKLLREKGWKVVRIWEHEIEKSGDYMNKIFGLIKKSVKSRCK
jgi:DNA mismatch endonuclease (patch repair protein)